MPRNLSLLNEATRVLDELDEAISPMHDTLMEAYTKAQALALISIGDSLSRLLIEVGRRR